MYLPSDDPRLLLNDSAIVPTPNPAAKPRLQDFKHQSLLLNCTSEISYPTDS